jgi:hypothetical protein
LGTDGSPSLPVVGVARRSGTGTTTRVDGHFWANAAVPLRTLGSFTRRAQATTLLIMTTAANDDPLAGWDPRRRAALESLWQAFKDAGGDEVSLSDELIAERRLEAAAEDGIGITDSVTIASTTRCSVPTAPALPPRTSRPPTADTGR